jgi:hypothetical protein
MAVMRRCSNTDCAHKGEWLTIDNFRDKTCRGQRPRISTICKGCERVYRTAYYSTPKGKDVKRKSNARYHAKKGYDTKYSKKYRSTLKGRFRSLLDQNKLRAKIALTYEEYCTLISQQCYYCGGEVIGNSCGYGLDQLIPGEGYTIENVVPCCIRCNRMKSDLLLSEFKEHIQRVYIHLGIGDAGG